LKELPLDKKTEFEDILFFCLHQKSHNYCGVRSIPACMQRPLELFPWVWRFGGSGCGGSTFRAM